MESTSKTEDMSDTDILKGLTQSDFRIKKTMAEKKKQLSDDIREAVICNGIPKVDNDSLKKKKR